METGTLHAKELPGKPHQPKVGDLCSGAVGKIVTARKEGLEVTRDKQGMD